VAITRPQHPLRLAVIVAIVLVAINAAIIGARAQNDGPVGTKPPVVVLTLYPSPGELQVPQDMVGADLRNDFAGQLLIDEHPIPQDQIDKSVNTAITEIHFTPGPGKDFSQLRKGSHSATVEFWPDNLPDDVAARAKHELGSYTWSFQVG
jgi:hypothetical protein